MAFSISLIFGGISNSWAAVEIVNFENFAAGAVVDQVLGDLGSGPIFVEGNTLVNGQGDLNTAIIFDTANVTGGDVDLGSPNEDCPGGGPGIGADGAPGEPFENCTPMGKVLILAEDLVDANNDDLIDDPDDIGTAMDGSNIVFDFSQLTSVIVHSLTIADVDEFNAPNPRVELFNGANVLLSSIPIPDVGDNGVVVLDLGSVPGVVTMVVHLNGSGAIDDLVFEQEERGGQGCTPGYWKVPHHWPSWTVLNPNDDYETTFGIDASFTLNLVLTMWQGGGGEIALGRHAVAGLLNAYHPGVDYAFTPAEVIQKVQDAYANGTFKATKNELQDENESGCPLDKHDNVIEETEGTSSSPGTTTPGKGRGKSRNK